MLGNNIEPSDASSELQILNLFIYDPADAKIRGKFVLY